MSYWFKPALKEAQIEERWVMGGVPLSAVAKYMGYSTIQMTMRYSHLVPKVHQAAVEAMNAFYEGDPGSDTRTSTDAIELHGQTAK